MEPPTSVEPIAASPTAVKPSAVAPDTVPDTVPEPVPEIVRIDARRRWFPDVAEVVRYRHLVGLMGRRDITVRYRQTVLGTVWIFGGALVTAGLFSFVFGRIASLPTNGVPYFAFSYAGLLAWNLFSQVLSSVQGSLNPNAGLITKIYFPRVVMPLSTIVVNALNTLVSLGIMMVILVIFGIPLTLQVLLLPVWLLLALILGFGIGLIGAAYSVTYRDVGFATPILISLLLYLSPVAYSIEAVPQKLKDLYLLNPVATILEGCRWSVLGGSYLPPAWAIAYTVVFSVAMLLIGLVVFTRREWGFADVI